MRERIILAPKSNETELLRTLSKYGVNSIFLHIFNATELSKYVLDRCGKFINEEFISRSEETLIIDSFINDIEFFKDSRYIESKNLSNTLYSLRLLIKDNEEETISSLLNDCEFIEKNKAIVEVYKKYIEYLNNNNSIDSIGLIRKCINECDEFDIEFISLKEYPLSPLEEELLNKVSKNKYIESSLIELFNAKEKNIDIKSYVRAYGSINEINHIISYINENKIPYDECNIVTCNNSYINLIHDRCEILNIPVSYTTGLPITYSHPCRLFKLINEWKNDKYGIQGLINLVTSDSFDNIKLINLLGIKLFDLNKFLNIIGSLKLSFDSNDNDLKVKDAIDVYKNDRYNSKYVKAIELVKEELNKGIDYLLNEYSIINNSLDKTSLTYITSFISNYYLYTNKEIDNDVIEDIYKKLIAQDMVKEGTLIVSNINDALCLARKHMFIVGMSSNFFPGRKIENYLLLDSDLELISNENAITSSKRIEQKIKSFKNLINLINSLDSSIYMSYSEYNLADLKSQNPSSVLFEISNANDYDAFMRLFKETKYFEHKLDNYEEIGKAYLDNKKIIVHENKYIDDDTKIQRVFSPTQIEEYFKCPTRFYLKIILGIKEPEEYDPYAIVDKFTFGNLYHELMEFRKTDRNMKFDVFKDKAIELFDEYIKTRPIIKGQNVSLDDTKEEFLDLAKSGFNTDPNNEILAAEEDLSGEFEGIKISGRVDRIEKDKDGQQIIADFKAKRTITHEENDFKTCIQVLLYAYMANMSGYNISRCEYRYPIFGSTVECIFDEQMKKELEDMLSTFKHSLDTNTFGYTDKPKEDCKFCKFKNYCKNKDKGEDDDE